jgi:hypothetical protein
MAAVVFGCLSLAASASAAPTWLAPTTLARGNAVTPSPLLEWPPAIAFAPDGEAGLAWSSNDGTEYAVQAQSRQPGGNWSAPTPLSPSGSDALVPRIGFDPAGNATALWSTGFAESTTETSTRPADGPWGPPTAASTPNGESVHL